MPPFSGWSGPQDARTVIIGEAWGESEELARAPFVGASGMELWRMLGEAWEAVAPEAHAEATRWMRYDAAWIRHRGDWMDAASIAFTNVFNLRPRENKIESLCETKKENKNAHPGNQISRGQYLREEFLPELDRLGSELAQANPNLIIPVGNTACWATLRATNIGSIRGTVSPGAPDGAAPGRKCLPTYHPAGVMRQWSWRPIVVADLMKARREASRPEIIRPEREIIVDPSLGDIYHWLQDTAWNLPRVLGVDIETKNGQITCIGFARSRGEALVVPFVVGTKNYWDSEEKEVWAWRFVRILLSLDCDKVFQNGMYDLQYLCRLGFRPKRCVEDTMLLHHSLYPELQKGLGFLGSIYTNEASWKLMRRQRAADAMLKRDE